MDSPFRFRPASAGPPRFPAWALAALWLASSGIAMAESGAVAGGEAATIDAYLDALPRIEARLARMSLSGRLTSERRFDDGSVEARSSGLEVVRRGPEWQQVVETFEPDRAPSEAVAEVPRRVVAGVNPEYGFMLEQKHEGGPYSLVRYEPGDRREAVAASIGMKARLLEGLHRMTLVESFGDVLRSRRGTAGGVKVVRGERDGRTVVTFAFPAGEAPPAKGSVLEPVSITVAPSEGWALLEAVTAFRSGAARILNTLTVEYEGGRDGFPLPRKIVDRRGESSRFVLDVEHVDFDEPDRARFALASFGLPEPGDAPGAPAGPGGYYYGIAALVALAAAAAYLARRLDRPAGGPARVEGAEG